MGQVITRYDVCALASHAFLKAFSPMDIQSGFRKTGIHPLKKNIIDNEKLLPCESFREQDPVSKVKAVKAGPERVEIFFKQKEEKIRDLQETNESVCTCNLKRNNTLNPSGITITGNDYISKLSLLEKKNQSIKKKPNNQHIKKNNQQKQKETPTASTSRIQIKRQVESVRDDCDMEVEFLDAEKCCVCKRYEPEGLKYLPYFKLVKWAKCDDCEHWVHLTFCAAEKIIRRQSTFLCPHCGAN